MVMALEDLFIRTRTLPPVRRAVMALYVPRRRKNATDSLFLLGREAQIYYIVLLRTEFFSALAQSVPFVPVICRGL